MMLPVEVLDMVLSFLSPRDLCRMCLVSRLFYRVATNPRYWTRVKIRRRSFKSDTISLFVNIERFKMVQTLNLSSLTDMREDGWLHVFVNLHRLNHLVELNLSYNNFLKVSNFALIPEVEILNFSYCQLTLAQTENIFIKSTLSKRIKVMVLKNINCSKIPEILFKSGSENLHTLDIAQDYNISAITPKQSTILFKMIILRKSMKCLNLSGVNLSSSSSHLLAKAVADLTTVDLSQCLLTTFQCEDMLEKIAKEKPSLSLVLDKIDISKVDCKKLSRAVRFVRQLSVRDCGLSKLQILGIMKECFELRKRQGEQLLEKINFASLPSMSRINSTIFASFFCQIQDINLSCCSLTEDQINSLITQKQHSIKTLDLSFNNFSTISSSLLGQFVQSLTEVSLAYTNLTAQQTLDIFMQILLETNLLRILNIASNDLSCLPPELLLNAVLHLDKADISFTGLTCQQVKKLLQEKRLDMKRRKVNLRGIVNYI